MTSYRNNNQRTSRTYSDRENKVPGWMACNDPKRRPCEHLSTTELIVGGLRRDVPFCLQYGTILGRTTADAKVARCGECWACGNGSDMRGIRQITKKSPPAIWANRYLEKEGAAP